MHPSSSGPSVGCLAWNLVVRFAAPLTCSFDSATRWLYVSFVPCISLFTHPLLWSFFFLSFFFCFPISSAGPSSQFALTRRLSGGAVPGGRGIGVIDLEQEEMRERDIALVRAGGGTLGLVANNATTADGCRLPCQMSLY